MDILHIIIKCIGTIIMAVSVVCAYDARKITKKFFSEADINTTTRTLKIIGLLVFCIGSAIVIWG